jgi:hypothetical protein
MLNGKTFLSILSKFTKSSEVGGNARVQIQMPNGDLHDITEVKLMENMLIGQYETHRIVLVIKTDAPRSVKLYESSAVTESGLSLVRSRACALDDWTAIRACLLGL